MAALQRQRLDLTRLDDRQATVAYHTYFPFGEEATAAAQDTERRKFTGHERDTLSTLDTADERDYMHARLYNPLVGRFLAVDSLGVSLRRPQSWNKYSYTRNNPIKYRDPTGLYVNGCVTPDKGCQDDLAAFEAARQENLKSQDDQVKASASAYGDPGQSNGITVKTGQTGPADAATGVYTQAAADGSIAIVGTVTFKPGLRGTILRGAVAHEGQHLLDGGAFVSTFVSLPADPWVSYDSSKNLTTFQTELNAFRLTHSIYKSAGEVYSTGCDHCSLGRDLRTAAEVDLAIKRILADPKDAYGVTPAHQGTKQLSEWP